MVNEKKLELIEELKALREEKGITYQEIADRTAEIGCPVSLSTIKHVFSDHYNHNHDYNNVLRPIADVLSPPADDDQLEIKILQTRLELKDEIIRQLQNRLNMKEQKHKDRENLLLEQIEFYKEQIIFKDSEIKRYCTNIDRKDSILRKLMFEDKEIDEVD